MTTLNLQNINLPINLKGKSSKSVEAFLTEYTNLNPRQIDELTSLKRGDESLLNANNYNNQGLLYEVIYLLNTNGYEYTLEQLTNIANDYKITINANFILETNLFEKEQKDYWKEVSRLRDKIENSDVESIVQCPKCKSYSVSYVRAEKQRSADEAEITKYTCNNIGCGNSWKN